MTRRPKVDRVSVEELEGRGYLLAREYGFTTFGDLYQAVMRGAFHGAMLQDEVKSLAWLLARKAAE